MEFNCETLISCLKNAKLPEIVRAPIWDKQTFSYQIVGMEASAALEIIEQEIATLKQYKMYKEEAEQLAKHIKYLNDKKTILETEIISKETQLHDVRDELICFLQTRGIATLDDLKAFFKEYDSEKEYQMNKSLDEYYSHKNRII